MSIRVKAPAIGRCGRLFYCLLMLFSSLTAIYARMGTRLYEAHRRIQKLGMDRGKKMVEIAEAIILADEIAR